MADEEVWNDVANDNPGPVNDKGVADGEGVLTFPAPPAAEDEEEKPAPTFAGRLDAGIRQGPGKYMWSDGSAFVGTYELGAKHGFGTLAFADGSKYEGNFEAGVVSGEGTWTYSNGDMYKGSFVDGKKHGTGCYHFAKPKCQFIGSFDAGAFVSGRWMLSDGSFVDAAFAAGDAAGVYIPAGTATCKFAQAGLVQEGTFGPGMTWQGQAISAA